ncbi:autotransporter domain-containing protein [Hyphomicrobium sp. 99]|uniref:autotransporter domain-containing protein n=1 Tax=Hyphomicrobium sp. 99 TaxID=1163419 RepID=UPI0005F7D3F8|nr:autotransporter domain-containing protein [Hyphomicrobium sp. 99]
MFIRKIRFICDRGVTRASIASLAVLFCVASGVRAEDCVDVQSSTAEPDFMGCDQEIQFDLDAALAEQSVPAATAAPTDGLPWIALSKGTVPSKFNANDGSVSVRTSLGTLRDYNSQTVSVQRPEYAVADPYTIKLPKAASAPTTPVDVWSNIDLNGLNGSSGQSSRVGFGADYKISRKASVGLSLERGDARSSSTSGVAQDQKAAAYVTLQAAPMFSIDARTEWEANGGSASSTGTSDKSAIILAPKVNHSFSLEGGTTLEPFVTYKRAFDLSTSRKEAADTSFDTTSAGAGVTYTKPDAYSLSVTADVDNLGASTEPQSLSSKFQLSVPLR